MIKSTENFAHLLTTQPPPSPPHNHIIITTSPHHHTTTSQVAFYIQLSSGVAMQVTRTDRKPRNLFHCLYYAWSQ